MNVFFTHDFYEASVAVFRVAKPFPRLNKYFRNCQILGPNPNKRGIKSRNFLVFATHLSKNLAFAGYAGEGGSIDHGIKSSQEEK